MPSVSFGTFSKKINSTKRPGGLSDSRNVKLKETTSVDSPTFIVSGNEFNYNYAKWDNRYYFISDIRSRHDNLTEVDCALDVLATYKDEILAGTQYVSYSNVSGGQWLADTRIPVSKESKVKFTAGELTTLFNRNGFYVLTATGKDGCQAYAIDKSQLATLLDRINNWSDDLIDDILAGNYPWSQGSSAVTYDFSDVEHATESLAKMNMLTGLCGNAYSQAPSCIRSCIWVPFQATHFTDTGKELYLGSFDTGLSLLTVKAEPYHNTITRPIPWHYNDWRRMYEEVYIYLPLAGMVKLASSELTHMNSIYITYSATATDGVVSYMIHTPDGAVLGTYGGQCSANYPIGINQQASAGEIMQSIAAGSEKIVSAAINSSISPISMGASAAGMAIESSIAAYNIADTAISTHASTIGGIGGGAGVGLDINATIYTVAHPTVIEPSQMLLTMGVPTMKPLQLSSCSGYCQCANAHVDAPAMAHELAAIDQYLNSGFYIE